MTKALEDRGYETTLVRGVEAPQEGSMDDLAHALDVSPTFVRSLSRELGPHDLTATLAVARIIIRVRPHVLHTHAAKAGTVGRLAALLAGSRGPAARVHTFHGHVLSGYFGARKERLFTVVERTLARTMSTLVAVSDEVKDDLVALRIAPERKIRVVPLGFDLTKFALGGTEQRDARVRVRAEMGVHENDVMLCLVARLVPIKRVDRFLDVARRLADVPNVRFVVVGDGELGDELRASDAAKALGDRLVWAGMRRDMPAVMAAADVVCLTSDNEGTPVSLIEAQAASRPVVSTRVGGVASAVSDGVTGHLVQRDDVDAFAKRGGGLLTDRGAGAALGQAGRPAVMDRFSRDRLADDLDALYRDLLP